MLKSASITATNTLVATPARVVGVYVRSAATAGSLILKDGGSGGTTMMTVNTPAAAGWVWIPLPEPGMDFLTDVHGTLATADGAMVIYK